MTCRDVRQQLMDLDVSEFDAIAHLATCPDCRRLADDIRRAEGGLVSHVEDFAHGGGDFDEAWAAAVGAATGRRWWPAAAGIALAASLIVAVRVGLEVRPPPIDAPVTHPPAAAPIPSPGTPEPAPAPPVAPEPSPAIAPARPAMAPPPPRPAPRRPVRPMAAPAPAPEPPPEPAPPPALVAPPAVEPPPQAPAVDPLPAVLPAPPPRPSPSAPEPAEPSMPLQIEVGATGYTGAVLSCAGQRQRARFDGAVLSASVPPGGCEVRLKGAGPAVLTLAPGRYRLEADGGSVRAVPQP